MKQILKRTLLLISCVIILALPLTVGAQVISTQEQTNGDSVYIAGNPDMYPIEYYDRENKCFKGILPDLYAQISQQTGVEFAYVSAGNNNQQQRLAKNQQVEMVSAFYEGDVTGLVDTCEVLSYDLDGKTYHVCIGFTKIADDALISSVEAAIENIDESQMFSSLIQELDDYSAKQKQPLHMVLLVLFAVICVILVLVLVKSKRRENKKKQFAHIDALTGIGNQEYFEYCFRNYITVNTYGLYYMAYIGVDYTSLEKYMGSEKVNDIQKYSAEVLRGYISDADFVARIDNGVFALAYQAVSLEQAQIRLGELLVQLDGYKDRFTIEYHMPFFAGLFAITSPTISCDLVMYNAKQGYQYAVLQKQKICVSDTEFLAKEATRSRLLKKITDAINKEHFSLNLQFVVDVKKECICGAEVLSRWVDPEDGIQSPAVYIEEMINSGIIDRLDFLVLEKVCQKLESWKGTEYDGLYLSCNFARPTISSSAFLKQFLEITQKYQFDRKNLIIEMTEDSLAESREMVLANIQACKQRGFRVALDDLGSGYTSFRDLSEYPIDIIKVDRHIITRSVTERGNALLHGIVYLARRLGIQVLCEGVETPEENEVVRDAGCDYIQGYYYSRVIPEEHAMDFYKKKRL